MKEVNKREKSNSVQTNEKSKQYLVRRFKQDFRNATNSQGITEGMINYFNANEILREMGFISSQNNIETNEERILFVDFWRWLKGDENDGVKCENLKIFLGAIEGFNFWSPNDERNLNDLLLLDKVSPSRKTPSITRKRYNSSNSRNKNKEQPFPAFDIQFNNEGLIDLANSEIKEIQNYFFAYARNRSKFVSEQNHK